MEPIFLNRILKALPTEEIRIMRPLMTRVRLVRDQAIYEGGERIELLYFIEDGLVTTTAPFNDPHEQVQVDVLGRRDVVGLATLLNGKASSFHRTTVQMPGVAYRIAASALRNNLARLPTLERCLFEAIDISHARIAQNFACRTTHSLSKRLARWLLMTRDLCKSDSLEVTQEFLAKMLAVRRPAVTVALGQFEAADTIQSRRGRIFIRDHDALRHASCDCDLHLLRYIAATLDICGVGKDSDRLAGAYVGKAHIPAESMKPAFS
jgi:CRP-like cAMP-binding protein